MLKAIEQLTRYAVEVVKPEKIVTLKQDWKTFLECVSWFLVYDSRYIQLGVGQERSAFWNDLRRVVEETPIINKRQIKKRLMTMLNNRVVKVVDGNMKKAYEKAKNDLA